MRNNKSTTERVVNEDGTVTITQIIQPCKHGVVYGETCDQCVEQNRFDDYFDEEYQ